MAPIPDHPTAAATVSKICLGYHKFLPLMPWTRFNSTISSFGGILLECVTVAFYWSRIYCLGISVGSTRSEGTDCQLHKPFADPITHINKNIYNRTILLLRSRWTRFFNPESIVLKYKDYPHSTTIHSFTSWGVREEWTAPHYGIWIIVGRLVLFLGNQTNQQWGVVSTWCGQGGQCWMALKWGWCMRLDHVRPSVPIIILAWSSGSKSRYGNLQSEIAKLCGWLEKLWIWYATGYVADTHWIPTIELDHSLSHIRISPRDAWYLVSLPVKEKWDGRTRESDTTAAARRIAGRWCTVQKPQEALCSWTQWLMVAQGCITCPGKSRSDMHYFALV